MNQIYTLIANNDKAKEAVLEELNLIANVFPSESNLDALIRARESTLYDRLTYLDNQRAGYINDFINETPALSIPQAHENDIKACAVKYIDALKQYAANDLNPLWTYLDNCSTSVEKQCAVWSFCDL